MFVQFIKDKRVFDHNGQIVHDFKKDEKVNLEETDGISDAEASAHYFCDIIRVAQRVEEVEEVSQPNASKKVVSKKTSRKKAVKRA